LNNIDVQLSQEDPDLSEEKSEVVHKDVSGGSTHHQAVCPDW